MNIALRPLIMVLIAYLRICCLPLLLFILLQQAVFAQADHAPVPIVSEMLIFPMHHQHTHASSLAYLPNGDFLAVWYQGSGEKESDNVKIMGARLKKGAKQWSDSFLMADTHNIPDCNPMIFINNKNKLFLIWIAVQANHWEYSILRVKTSVDYLGDGPPVWDWQDDILLKPGDEFAKEMALKIKDLTPPVNAKMQRNDDSMVMMSRDAGKRSIGWMTRIKPLILDNGRILLPLYSDGFSMSLIAISDDDGVTWRASLPIVGRGNVQPSLVQKKNGDIMAYMRDNGPDPARVQLSVSKDNGETWSAAIKTDIPNTASVNVYKMLDGRWVFVGDDIDDGRYRLSLYVSDDEGATWKWKRTLENVEKDKGSFSYPCIVQTPDGLLHITYSYSLPQKGESIKYVVVDPNNLGQ